MLEANNLNPQNSRLDAHREISDTLLREMKELRHRSDVMEKRLRELEIDNAVSISAVAFARRFCEGPDNL